MRRRPWAPPAGKVQRTGDRRLRDVLGHRASEVAAMLGDVGTAGTFERLLDGRTLSFEAAGENRFRNRQTGSTWDVTGRATAGALAGRRLQPVVSDQQFWFALAAFLPDARIVGG